jgi:hypothetical protein
MQIACKNNKDCGLSVAALVFAIVGLINLTRVLTQFPVVVNGALVPIGFNVLAIVFAWGLSVWLWSLKKA